MPKVALISGVTGQNGAYPDETLLNKGYVVHGLRRRSSSFNSGRIEHLYQDLHEADVRFVLHYGDLTDATNLIRLIQQIGPDEIYNLGAQGHVYVSFETPEYTANGDGFCRRAGGDPHPRFREEHTLLSSVDVGAVRQGAGDSASDDDREAAAQMGVPGQHGRLQLSPAEHQRCSRLRTARGARRLHFGEVASERTLCGGPSAMCWAPRSSSMQISPRATSGS
jgi:hypothetical protein